jgi:hypothetical protein
MTKFIAPVVHLNGTSKADLLDQFRSMALAVKSAAEILCEHFPHARDYYVIRDTVYGTGNNPYSEARAQHEQRIETLRTMYHELYDIFAAIDAQGKR